MSKKKKVREMRVTMVQNGPREHFLIPKSLEIKGLLSELVVDWYAPRNKFLRKLMKSTPIKALQRAAGVYTDEIPAEKVTSMPLRGGLSRIFRKFTKGKYKKLIHLDKKFSENVSQLRLKDHDIVIGYAYASLELFKKEKQEGHKLVLGQINPGFSEYLLMKREHEAWPECASWNNDDPAAFFERNRQEWALADIIIINSEWSKKLLIEDGAPAEKLKVIPLAYERPEQNTAGMRPTTKRLSVLWIGSVILRKGIQYLIEAAKSLGNVEFIIAGPIGINEDMLKNAPENIKWLGQVPRSKTEELYQQADVFILPTVSDGFAITQLEALSYGLPLIVTRNCAELVVEGESGFYIPACNSQAIVETVNRILANREMLEEMRTSCVALSRKYSLKRYADDLVEILRDLDD